MLRAAGAASAGSQCAMDFPAVHCIACMRHMGDERRKDQRIAELSATLRQLQERVQYLTGQLHQATAERDRLQDLLAQAQHGRGAAQCRLMGAHTPRPASSSSLAGVVPSGAIHRPASASAGRASPAGDGKPQAPSTDRSRRHPAISDVLSFSLT